MRTPRDDTPVEDLFEYMRDGRVPFMLAPEFWGAISLPVKLKWSRVHFSATNSSKVPSSKLGVYCFLLRPDVEGPPDTAYLLYIGKTQRNFRVRFREYLIEMKGKRSKDRWTISSMLNKWPEWIWFYFAPIEQGSMVPEVENELVNRCVPPFNPGLKGNVDKAARRLKNLGGFR